MTSEYMRSISPWRRLGITVLGCIGGLALIGGVLVFVIMLVSDKGSGF